ncbi:unnamed protein product [Bursaphelenchus xylophilus]|uniref:(pine wood nematode) hypothetical protein n=1 Tax=Bursaphelenchus xylophilus TaxID=6326 RepID=A0A1I7S3R4_BURXY|nr:unnamed protein product [Bursaphelenchus xylophilus]CAG9116480.1 unnamed protein product [Bursaphelenchus xylophilus]
MNCESGPARPSKDEIRSHLDAPLRPHSNSICGSLLNPEKPNRACMHRSSDGLLLSDQFRLSTKRESIRPSIQDDFYYQTLHARQESSIFATVWASYIFVFISVLITFSIVFSVGYLLSSMTANQRTSGASLNSTYNFTETSMRTVERVRDVLQLKKNNNRPPSGFYSAQN